MKIIDVFSFCGEIDILKLRLSILDRYVDEFIICEGDETTAGNPKPRYFEQHKQEFKMWLPRIKYHIFSSYSDPIMQAFSQAYLPIPKEQHWWHREFIQKESMRYALTHLQDEDLVFIGDVDEIWDPQVEYLDERAELQQTVYSYYLDNKSSEHWTGTSVMRYKHIRNETLDNLRAYDERRKYMHAPVIKSGWHFTNQGGAKFVKQKIQSYAHQEFNTPEYLALVEQRIANNQDYLGRDFKLGIDTKDWPQYLKDHRPEWAHLCKGTASQPSITSSRYSQRGAYL